MVNSAARHIRDARSEPRDEVHHRTRGLAADGRALTLTVVNLSSGGLMARCDAALARDEAIRLHLPVVGMIGARVRWALGGRIGCQLDTAIGLAEYYQLLATIRRA